MQSSKNTARMNFFIKRSRLLLNEKTNLRPIHTCSSVFQRPILTANQEANDTDLTKINRELCQKVANDGLRTFIEKVTAKPKEARMWLKYFKSKAYWDEGQAFCVLHITEDVFYNRKVFETFVWSAAFLMQNKMKPVIVFGTRRKMKETIQDVENKMEILGNNLVKLLENHGVQSEFYTADHQVLQTNDGGKLNIEMSTIKDSLLRNQIPIITNFLKDDKEDFRLYDPVRVAEIITCSMKPMKLMLLSCEKGIQNASGTVVSEVILPFAASQTRDPSWCFGENKKKVDRVGLLLEKLPPESSVILTSADTVIQELFTHHGSGTLIKRSEPVKRFESLDSVNTEELALLLSESFQKPLPKNYFSDIKGMVDAVYVTESYSAAVVILRLPNLSVPYMDKFAVRTSAQGIGLTTQIWTEVVKDYQQLFWRSSPDNKGALGWYNTVCQGSWKDSSWIVFWYGLETCKEVFPLIEYAAKRKPTFPPSVNVTDTDIPDQHLIENVKGDQDRDSSEQASPSGSLDFGFMYDNIPGDVDNMLPSKESITSC